MKRFYKHVALAERGGGLQIELDGRGVKTALGHAQILPTSKLAQSMAREWTDQGEEIDPTRFQHRDLADYAIDIVAPDTSAAIAKLITFAETDTLCYRAQPDEPFFKRQGEVWEPLVTRIEAQYAIVLTRVSGIIHQPLGDATKAALGNTLAELTPFQLAALHTMTSLSASLCIGMAALAPDADAMALWSAANLEEDWQIEQWGQDYEAADVRKRKTAEFMNAFDFSRLLDAP